MIDLFVRACVYAGSLSSLLLLLGCGRSAGSSPQASPATNRSGEGAGVFQLSSSETNAQVPMQSYEVLHSWPHDPRAFTQGLVFLDGELIESTGLNGQSSLRRVDLESGRVLQQVQLPYQYFAEGLAVFGRK